MNYFPSTVRQPNKSFIYFTPREFFLLVLAGDILLESEWQQVSSSLHDSSEYYDRFL